MKFVIILHRLLTRTTEKNSVITNDCYEEVKPFVWTYIFNNLSSHKESCFPYT